ncbi:nuclear transport factor 2 family protein [Vibrio ostreicida]|uniref:Nuclear transport factor 2 family protein n=1 Tax=Vibrio ostreicida TaxID=526588 RepID=A0ABT8BZ91_9VIBR|nr:nuclear transport factor 2 family protein [Vibrio ostreicida]MDN3612147.1 nuclear transport factor 2 family protein [Vibrio ostreicida]NPD08545.1 SnoaL-like domain-containing protein [Vibrio ostreicida]
MSQFVLDACQAGIDAWKSAFNLQDAKGCAQQYAEEAVMVAKPFGTFEGRQQIEAFWQHIVDEGFKDVAYTEITWKKVDDSNYVLSSKWTMNKAYGLVHKEVWTLQNDGKARLTYDEFEVLGER